ncbi:MAG: phage tail protein [Burkholderiaceae bacterium]
MTTLQNISAAASAAAQAAERTRQVVRLADAGAAAATPAAALVQTSLQTATQKLNAAASIGAKLMDATGAAAAQRSLAAVQNAISSVTHSIGQIAGGAVGKLFAPDLQGATAALSGAAGKVGDQLRATAALPAMQKTVPAISSLAKPVANIAPAATGASPHLLILTSDSGASFYFGLSTAAFDSLKRSTKYNVASQERLQRPEALQSVSQGGESINISGAIFTTTKSGGRQIERLRTIGAAMLPVQLATGYGDILGRWYLTQIDEEQSALMSDGAPRKQQFTLEFKRYGDDYQKL